LPHSFQHASIHLSLLPVSGVYGVNYVLAMNVLMVIPSWNQFCLNLNISASTVSLSVNRNNTVVAMPISGLFSPAAIILNSRISVTSEMFSNVNLYNQSLGSIDYTAPGNILAWDVSDWKYNTSIANVSSVIQKETAEVLGNPTFTYLMMSASLTMAEAVNICTNFGQGNLPDPVNLLDWQKLLNYTTGQQGPSFNAYPDVWFPYTSPFMNSNSSSFYFINNSSKNIDSSLWAASQPSRGDSCVHCTWKGCFDDDCDTYLDSNICTFSSNVPIFQLRGLCQNSLIGNHCTY